MYLKISRKGMKRLGGRSDQHPCLAKLPLGAVAGLLVAFALSLVFPLLPTGAWFALGFMGSATGVIWFAVAHSSPTASIEKKLSPISTFIAYLGVAAIGGLWGTLVERLLGMPVAIACILIAPAIVGPVLGAIAKTRISVSSIALATAASLFGFSTPYAISWLSNAGA